VPDVTRQKMAVGARHRLSSKVSVSTTRHPPNLCYLNISGPGPKFLNDLNDWNGAKRLNGWNVLNWLLMGDPVLLPQLRLKNRFCL
jgi:hypothetical protein